MDKENDFEDPHEKIDKMFKKKEQPLAPEYKSKRMQQVYDNLEFAKQVRKNPVTTTKYDKKIFGEALNFGPYMEMRVWPRSIYVTDKLLRLVASARLEFLKRYLAKKRKMPFDYKWLLILLVGIPVALLILIFLLPRLTAAL